MITEDFAFSPKKKVNSKKSRVAVMHSLSQNVTFCFFRFKNRGIEVLLGIQLKHGLHYSKYILQLINTPSAKQTACTTKHQV